MESNTWYYLNSTIAQSVAGLLAVTAAFVLYKLQNLANEITMWSNSIQLRSMFNKTWENLNKMMQFEQKVNDRQWQEVFKYIFESKDRTSRSLFGQPTVYSDIIEKVDLMAKNDAHQEQIVLWTKYTTALGLSLVIYTVVCISINDIQWNGNGRFWLSVIAITATTTFALLSFSIFLNLLKITRREFPSESERYLSELKDPEIIESINKRLVVDKPEWIEKPNV